MRTQIPVEDLHPTALVAVPSLLFSGPNLLSVLVPTTVALVYGQLSIWEENQSVKTEKYALSGPSCLSWNIMSTDASGKAFMQRVGPPGAWGW